MFKGWKEGKTFFSPYGKLTTCMSCARKRNKRDVWLRSIYACRCDRILWYGEGIEQVQYIRGESWFSDHRPVCAVFVARADVSRKDDNNASNKSIIRRLMKPLEN